MPIYKYNKHYLEIVNEPAVDCSKTTIIDIASNFNTDHPESELIECHCYRLINSVISNINRVKKLIIKSDYPFINIPINFVKKVYLDKNCFLPVIYKIHDFVTEYCKKSILNKCKFDRILINSAPRSIKINYKLEKVYINDCNLFKLKEIKINTKSLTLACPFSIKDCSYICDHYFKYENKYLKSVHLREYK